MQKSTFLFFLLILCSLLSCKKKVKATSPEDLMRKLQIALDLKDEKRIKEYLIIDSTRTPEMAEALSELIVRIKNPKPFPKGSGNIRLPKFTSEIVLNLQLNVDFTQLLNGIYNEELEELRVKKIVEKPNITFEIEHVVEVKKTKDGFKFWPIGIENNAIIYTNELYKRLPNAYSADSITQRKNVDRLFDLYVPKEEQIMEWK